jgi:hypothetical protein
MSALSEGIRGLPGLRRPEHAPIPFRYASLISLMPCPGADMRQWEIHRILAELGRLLAAVASCYFSRTASADEAGTSFWLPGQYGSFAAVPSDPGWSFESAYYHASAEASGGVDFERGGSIQTGIKSPSDFFMFAPTYAFKTIAANIAKPTELLRLASSRVGIFNE